MSDTDFPYNEFQLTVKSATENLNGRTKACIRNAYHHIEKAWILYDVDKEMCLFRLITAEEEAATALILALKLKQYPEASKLNHRSHPHKCSIHFFISSVNNLLVQMNPMPKMNLHFNKNTPKVSISICINEVESVWATNENPLDFLVSSEGKDFLSIFSQEISNISLESEFLDFVKKEANRRNEIIYADDTGSAKVTFEKDLFNIFSKKIHTLSLLTIAVCQTNKHQIFVVQCMHSLLKELKKIEESDYDFQQAVTDARIQ